jgi:hypothetical protein
MFWLSVAALALAILAIGALILFTFKFQGEIERVDYLWKNATGHEERTNRLEKRVRRLERRTDSLREPEV